MTAIALLCGLLAGGLLALGWNVAAGAAIVAAALFDTVDGELARLKGRASRFGAVFDAVSDRYADAAILGGMTVFAARFEGWPQPEAVGLAALAGALAAAYASARIRASLGDRPGTSETWLGGRDLRLAVAATAAVIGQCYWALAVIAATTALAVIWRLADLRLRRVGTAP